MSEQKTCRNEEPLERTQRFVSMGIKGRIREENETANEDNQLVNDKMIRCVFIICSLHFQFTFRFRSSFFVLRSLIFRFVFFCEN